jgi:hypothetical protein
VYVCFVYINCNCYRGNTVKGFSNLKQGLYLLSPKAPPWRVTGLLYLFFLQVDNICMTTAWLLCLNYYKRCHGAMLRDDFLRFALLTIYHCITRLSNICQGTHMRSSCHYCHLCKFLKLFRC